MAEMSVGHELLNVPLPEMVARMGIGIALAQRQLDRVSVDTARLLGETEVEMVPGYTQRIAADGTVSYTAAQPIKLNLLQIGLLPTFYHFAETTIEVEMDIKVTTSSETNVKVGAEGKVGFGMWSASVSSEVAHNRKYGKEVHGTSRLMTRLVTVPPPERLEPVITVIDERQPAEEE